jgi:IgA peptidase M64
VSEGYAAPEGEQFFDDARRASETILAASPYDELANSLSVSALFVPCRESGIPLTPEHGDDTTNFATTYGTFGMTRYLVSMDLHALRRASAGIPHASLIVLANASHYGGSGIFNSNCCVAARMPDEDFTYVLLHELGHSLGGLADEYFGRPITYSTDPGTAECPWEPNVSPLDAHGRVKWASRIASDVPVPTPWSHAEYLQLAAVPQDAPLAPADRDRRRREEAALLAREPYRGRIGAFTGALYRPFGMYRPEVDCRMFSRSANRYCTICTETIRDAIGTALRTNPART